MKRILLLSLLSVIFSIGFTSKSSACHAIALVNWNQQQYVPGTGMQVTAASDSPTCGCGAYWLDVEVRCMSDVMNGAGVTAGNYGPAACFPYYQGAQMFKTSCVVQNYPWVTIPESELCPGTMYQYRLRENHNGAVGPWTAVMTFTTPGVAVPFTPGNLTLTATPTSFCGSTQLGFNWTPGTGCTAGSCGGVPQISYQWYVLAGEAINVPVNFSCDTCPYPIASPSIPTTYGLTISVGDTNACGHGVYTMTPITVTPLPFPIADTITSIVDCNTGAVTMTAANGSGNRQWQTSLGGGIWTDIVGSTGTTYFEPAPGPVTGQCYRTATYTVCDTAYSNLQCSGALGNLIVDFNSMAACEGQGMQFTDLSLSTGSALTTWDWDFGDSNIGNTQSPLHIYTTAGTYTVVLTATNANGCQSSMTRVVTVDPMPAANFGLMNVCEDETANFTDMSTVSTGTIIDWTWALGSTFTSNVQNPSQLYATPDTYTIDLTVTSDKGCVNTTSQTLEVFARPVVDFSAASICSNEGPVVFNNNSSITVGTIVGWDWDFGDSNTDATQSPSHSYAAHGNYTIQLVATSDNGCADSTTRTIDVFEAPVAQFGPTNTVACGDTCINFLDMSTVTSSNVAAWDWTFGNGTTSKDANPNPCFTYTGANGLPQYYDVTLLVVTADGCRDSITVTNSITLNEQPIASFTPSPGVTDEYNSDIDFDNTTTGATDYDWDFGDASGSILFEPDHLYLDTGVFTVTLTATTPYNCSDVAIGYVTIEPAPSCNLPNAFSPNGDGLNDVLYPVLYGYKNISFNMQVFDRDGHIVYSSSDPNNGWDGSTTKNGTTFDSKTDLFVWKITIEDPETGNTDEFAGHVTVLR